MVLALSRRVVAGGRCMLWYEGTSNFIMRSLPPAAAEGKTLLLGLEDWEQSVIYGRKLSDSMAASRLVTKTIMDGKTTFLIGVAGGTASGKSTVCQKIMEQLGQADMTDSQRKVACIAQDSFYKELNAAESLKAAKGQYDFDHPNALDIDLMVDTLKNVLSGKKTEVPVYDYVANARVEGETLTIYPADVVLFEGILAFYFPQVRELFDMKLFVDTDPDTRLSRRVLRDVQDRGRDLDTVLSQYMRFVKPAFEEFCLPTKKFADVIIPRGADNIVAISLIVQHIQDLLSSTKKVTQVLSSDNDSIGSPVKEKPNPVAAKEGVGSQPTLPPQKRRMTNELSRPH